MASPKIIFITRLPAITCSKLTIETLEQDVKYVHWRRSGVFIVNSEQVNAGWVKVISQKKPLI